MFGRGGGGLSYDGAIIVLSSVFFNWGLTNRGGGYLVGGYLPDLVGGYLPVTHTVKTIDMKKWGPSTGGGGGHLFGSVLIFLNGGRAFYWGPF